MRSVIHVNEAEQGDTTIIYSTSLINLEMIASPYTLTFLLPPGLRLTSQGCQMLDNEKMTRWWRRLKAMQGFILYILCKMYIVLHLTSIAPVRPQDQPKRRCFWHFHSAKWDGRSKAAMLPSTPTPRPQRARLAPKHLAHYVLNEESP